LGPGQRVLELGSGVGDVAMLVATIVGPSGEVVAIERDARTISRARARAGEAGLHNIDFVQTDIAEYSTDLTFDAAVGRYILQFLPNPEDIPVPPEHIAEIERRLEEYPKHPELAGTWEEVKARILGHNR